MLKTGRHMEATGSLQRKSVVCHTSSLRSALPVMRPNLSPRSMSSATQSLEGLASRSTSQRRRTTAKAAAQESSGHSKQVALPPGLLETTVLGGLFATWYLANIVFNIYNKEVLKVFPFPMTCTTVQFLVGSVLAIFCWVTGLCKAPQLSTKLLTRIAPLALVHTLGNLLTNMSLGAVAVSFTHTIKAMEPIFSVGLSALFLHDYPHPLVILTLFPIIGGVVMASISEATFNWFGFSSAMASNLTFQSRNVLSKKMMAKETETETAGARAGATTTGPSKSQGLDNINLFGIITCMSFLMLLPVNLAVEGWGLTPTALQTMGITNPIKVIIQAAITGLCFHAYQQVSYMILSRVSPVTHSIGNCVKRVVVIVASVLFFKNPMTTQSAAGTAIALLGVFAYSQAKRMTGKAKAKAA